MTGRESCRQFESTGKYGAVTWRPNRVGECLTTEPLWHSREMDGEDRLHRGGIGSPIEWDMDAMGAETIPVVLHFKGGCPALPVVELWC